ncbi:MAG TPA: glycerophosphodiester phosphodiesterase family protein [Salinimicrobium sp.]|nr:glycerophosphodiester phosphodiesterase family protein [Salinimicrobium sp.]
MNKFLKIGHRGAKAYVAENTIESMDHALSVGANGLEFDVHACKSGELVIIHDFTLDRTTNGNGEVTMQMWDDLKLLKVEENYRIPTLQEVLKIYGQKCFINIELKGLNTSEATAKILNELLDAGFLNLENIVVSSFQKNELFQLKKISPEIPLAVLSKASVVNAIEIATQLKAKAIHPGFGLITAQNVKQAQNAGFLVNTWTVNEPQDIERMKSYGVDGIISDFPDRL